MEQNQNGIIKIRIFTAIFLIQHFCLHCFLPFSKSYPEIDSTWSTAKCRRRMSFDTRYCIVYLCNALCEFSLKSKSTNFFPKHNLKSKARYQSIQARKKLLCHVIVNNCLFNVFCKFLIKIESTWRREIKEQTGDLTALW